VSTAFLALSSIESLVPLKLVLGGLRDVALLITSFPLKKCIKLKEKEMCSSV
jgi:hypothetical protein